MAYEKNPSYLRQKASGLYLLKLPIPTGVQHHYPSVTPGKNRTHIEVSLHTYNRQEAMRLRGPLVVKYEAEFRSLAGGVVTRTINPAQARVPLLRQAMLDLQREDLTGDAWEVEWLAVHDAIEQTHEQIKKTEGEGAATFAVRRMAQPDMASLNEAMEAFIKASTNKAQTVDTYRLAVREFLAYMKMADCFPEDVSDAKAVAYIDMLNAGPLSRTVKVKRLGGLHQIWESMRRRGWPRSPWEGLKLTNPARPTKAVGVAQRGADDDDEENEEVRPFTEAEALKVFTLPAPHDKRRRTYTRPLFRELYALGFITGMRLNEIVSLKPTDVTVLEDGWRVLNIPKGVAKKKASIRKIPVCHPVAVAILDRRLSMQGDNPKERLFSECSPGGPDNKPSWHVSKAMSIERLEPKRLGFTSEVNFHSTRRSFATLMENSLVTDVIGQQRYLGHAIPTQMHGVYSGGAGIEKLKKVVESLKYPEALEVTFRLALSAELSEGPSS
jgi:integrase